MKGKSIQMKSQTSLLNVAAHREEPREVSKIRNASEVRSRKFNLKIWFGMWIVGACLPLFADSAPNLSRYELALFTLLAVLGLGIIFGYGGEVSVGQPVIVGSSAYAAAVLSTVFHWPTLSTLPISLIAGVAISIVLNSPSIRLRGWYMAITTLLAVIIFPSLLFVFQHWTSGDYGINGIPPIPGMNLGLGGNSVREYEVVLAVTVLVYLLAVNLLESRWGLIIRGLRDCHNGLSACGGRQRNIRLSLTVVSALPVALAGWMTAHVGGYVVPDQFGFNQMLLFLGALLIGGTGTLWGPVVGTIIFEGISFYIGPFSVTNQLVLGAIIVVVGGLRPDGIVGIPTEIARKIGAWRTQHGTTRGSDPRDSIAGDCGSEIVPDDESGVLDSQANWLELAHYLSLGTATSKGGVALRCQGVAKSFDGVRALDGADLEVVAGKVTGLVGLNGSGKTTLLNTITGFISPDEGHVYLGEQEVTGLPAFRIARLGIRRSFQTPQLIKGASLYDNLVLGVVAGQRQRVWSSAFRGPGYRRRTSEIEKIVSRVCNLLGFDAKQANTPVGQLSLGLQRIAEIGRALVARPQVVCLDEPAAGLGKDELAAMKVVLERIADVGLAVLLVEHNLEFVYDVCDSVVVLDLGRVVDSSDQTRTSAPSLPAYVGGSSTVSSSGAEFLGQLETDGSVLAKGRRRVPQPHFDGQGKPPILKVESLCSWFGQAQALVDVSMSVKSGEIIGVLGANGAGKSTLLRSIARVHRRAQGSISFKGNDILGMSPYDVSLLGLGIVREGSLVFPDMTVVEHLKLARRLCELRRMDSYGEETIFEQLPVLAKMAHVKAGVLSGGQRQLLALATATLSGPTCLLLDEPSAGISESALEVIFGFVRRIADDGMTLIIAEQNEKWLVDLVDRSYWLDIGRMRSESFE
jgi:ABC-type branched-subunit amino acid transport system ATPase component/ABC-type branched-subunit amino acid transport system permease subunit